MLGAQIGWYLVESSLWIYTTTVRETGTRFGFEYVRSVIPVVPSLMTMDVCTTRRVKSHISSTTRATL